MKKFAERVRKKRKFALCTRPSTCTASHLLEAVVGGGGGGVRLKPDPTSCSSSACSSSLRPRTARLPPPRLTRNSLKRQNKQIADFSVRAVQAGEVENFFRPQRHKEPKEWPSLLTLDHLQPLPKDLTMSSESRPVHEVTRRSGGI